MVVRTEYRSDQQAVPLCAMTSRWGVESLGSSGKTVWVELRR
jgi:hypothetical protein